MSLLAIVGNETAPKFINAVFAPVPPNVSNKVVYAIGVLNTPFTDQFTLTELIRFMPIFFMVA